MLYSVLKVIVRLAAKIFCRKIIISDPSLLKEKGPLLIAANHPNSFFDAVIIDILFQQPVHSLTRGDVFSSPFNRKIFGALKMLPVYRTREGVENLAENYKTFEACLEIFRQNGVVSIFSEGQCENEWRLRPLKKGTARLAFKCWENSIPLKVMPLGINYSSFRRFGKNIFVNIGPVLNKEDFEWNGSEGARHLAFNNRLQNEMAKLVFEIPAKDKPLQQERLTKKISIAEKIALSIPALTGLLVHAPLYLPLKKSAKKKYGQGVHYDSMLLALLFICYPVYLLALTILFWLLLKSWWAISLLLILPLTAWSFVRVKGQLDK